MTIKTESGDVEHKGEAAKEDKIGGIEFVSMGYNNKEHHHPSNVTNTHSSATVEEEEEKNHKDGHQHTSAAENDTTKVVDHPNTQISNQEETNDIDSNCHDHKIPPMCYCPITNQIMQDPVVNREGDSLERSTIMTMEQQNTSNIYYPNRALQAYVEREVDRANQADSVVMGTLRKLDEQLKTGWDLLTAGSGELQHRPLPDAFYCPITFELPVEPVIDADGYTYERFAIERWIHKNHDSPVTRKSLLASELYNNNAVLNVLLHESDKSDETLLHPALRRWKEKLQSPSLSRDEFPTLTEEDDHPNNYYNNNNADDDDDDDDNAVARRRRGGLPSSGMVYVIPQGHPDYPTTPGELEERQRRRKRQKCTALLIILLIFAVLSFAFLYLPFPFVIVVLAIFFLLYVRRKMYHDATM